MMSEEAIIKIIDELKSKSVVVTRKELLEAGLTDYYIKKIDGKYLAKMSKGKYQITYLSAKKNGESAEQTIEKKRISSEDFFKNYNDFSCAIKIGDYSVAYDCLKTFVGSDIEHKSDMHNMIYGLLLRELLDESYDFSFLRDLYYFYEKNESDNSYFKALIDFFDAVMQRDFVTAYQNIEIFKNDELSIKGKNSYSVDNFFNLTEAIMKKSIDIVEDKEGEIVISDDEEICDDNNFLHSVFSRNYKAAYVELKKILGKKMKSGVDNSPIYALLLKEILGEEYDFSFIDGLSFKKPDKRAVSNQYYLFYRYLVTGDYAKAFKKIMTIKRFQYKARGFNDRRVLALCMLCEKIVKDLDLYEGILEDIKEKIENRKEQEDVSKNEETEIVDSATMKDNPEAIVVREVAEEQPKIVKEIEILEEKKPLKILKIEDDFVSLSDEEIIELLDSKDFIELNKELLAERSRRVLDTYRYVLSGLVSMYINALRGNVVLKDGFIEREYVYKTSDAYSYLKKVLKTWDIRIIREALYQLKDVLQDNGVDDRWVPYYFMLVEEIEEVLVRNREDAEKKKYVDEQFATIDAKIFKLLNNREMSDDDFIDNVEKLYYEKLNVDGEDKNVLLGLDIISLIRTVKAERLSEDDFYKPKVMEGTTLAEKYNSFIDNCDYLKLKQLLEENDFDGFFFKGAKRRSLFFERRLLRILGDSFSIWKESGNKLSSSDEVMPADAYAKVKSLLKKNDAIGAYVYAKKYESLFSTDMIVLINSLLYVAQKAEFGAVQELYDDYRNKLTQGTKHEASVALLNYRERIKGKYLDYNTIYLEKMLNVKDFDSKTTKTLNDLMEKANDLIDLQDYVGAIRVLDDYNKIVLKKIDRGYYVQAMCYELMGEEDKAMTLYQYCVSIMQNPSAYLKLGMIYLEREEYEKSLECFLNCQSRRMTGNKEVLDCLAIVSRKLKRHSQAEEYKKELKFYN